MAMVIKPKRKFTAGAPSTSDIVEGEIAINTADKKLYVRDNANNIIEIGGSAGGSTTEVTQSSHGFAVKDAIRHNGTAWVKAQADDGTTLALGVVVVVTDSNTFTVAQSGRFELSSHGLTVGQWYYLSASSAGGLVTTEPTISQPIVYVESSNHIFVYPYRPSNLLISGTSDIIPGDNRVTTAKIADDAVTSAKIADDAITSALIADDAVGAAAIADNSIDIARLNVSDGSNGQALTTNGSGTLSFTSVGTADGSISTAKLADDAVTSAKIADDAITSALIADDAITSALIADDAVVAAAIADNAVDIARLNVSDGTSGQVLTTNGSGALSFATVGGAYNAWSIKTADYTAVSKDQLIVNSSSAKTITLPSSPSAGDTVVIRATGGGLVTVGRNSSNINSSAADGTLGSGNSTQLVYVDGTIGWLQL